MALVPPFAIESCVPLHQALFIETHPPSPPTAEMVVGTWLVHGFEEPAYSLSDPVLPNSPSADVMFETTRSVVEACPDTDIAVEDAYGNCDACFVELEKKTP